MANEARRPWIEAYDECPPHLVELFLRHEDIRDGLARRHYRSFEAND